MCGCAHLLMCVRACTSACSRDLFPPRPHRRCEGGRWGGKDSGDLICILGARSARAATWTNRVRRMQQTTPARQLVSRASSALYWRWSGQELLVSPHLHSGRLRKYRDFFFFCSVKLNSSKCVFAAGTGELGNRVQWAADCRVHQLKPTTAVEKLLLGRPVGFKVQLTVASQATSR